MKRLANFLHPSTGLTPAQHGDPYDGPRDTDGAMPARRTARTRRFDMPTRTARIEIAERLKMLDAIDQAAELLGVEVDQFTSTGHVRIPDEITDKEAATDWIERHFAVVTCATGILGWAPPRLIDWNNSLFAYHPTSMTDANASVSMRVCVEPIRAFQPSSPWADVAREVATA